MTTFTAVAIAIVVISMVNVLRLTIGPTVFDRTLAVAAIGANTIALVSVMGFMFARPEMFVDVAIAYSLLAFIGVVVLAKYLERTRNR
jgi:multicomponent Na+:H+ antiporter subunit F